MRTRLLKYMRSWCLGSATALGFATGAAAGDRVASADFCADQYVLAYADRGDIVAVSFEAGGPNSFHAVRAAGLPIISGSAEEILSLRPDVLVRSWRGSAGTDALFFRAGTRVIQPPWAMSPDDNFTNMVLIADEFGNGAAAQATVEDYRARWAALKTAPKSPLKAAYLTPSGYTAGEGTFVDAIIRLAGFGTTADAIGLKGWGPLPLEAVVMNPPDLVIGSFFEAGIVHVSNWSGGRHGAYGRMIDDLPAIMVPSRFLSCSGAFFVDAAEHIRAEATKLGLYAGAEAAP